MSAPKSKILSLSNKTTGRSPPHEPIRPFHRTAQNLLSVRFFLTAANFRSPPGDPFSFLKTAFLFKNNIPCLFVNRFLFLNVTPWLLQIHSFFKKTRFPFLRADLLQKEKPNEKADQTFLNAAWHRGLKKRRTEQKICSVRRFGLHHNGRRLRIMMRRRLPFPYEIAKQYALLFLSDFLLS